MPARVMNYWWWLDTHGLTRKQVDDDISLDDHDWFPKIDAAKTRAIEMKQKQAQRESQQPRSRHF